MACQNPLTLQRNLMLPQNKRKPTQYTPPLPNGLVIIRTGSLVGDLNETIERWDRKKLSENTYSYHGTGTKFIQHFLNDSRGVDLWRMLHPPDEKDPESGHTCFQNQGRSSAR